MACISESSCDEEEVVLSPSTLDHAAAFVVYPKPSRREQPRASDEVSSDISMAARPKVMPKSPPPQAQGYASQASPSSSTAVVQAYRGPVAKMPAPKSKSVAKRTPPFPSVEKCRNCEEFSYKGSTAYTIKATCFAFGNSTTTRREERYPYTFENCPHEVVDRRGSSKTTSRVFCKQCGNFVHEEPADLRKQRVAVGKRTEETPEDVFRVVQNITSVEANQELSDEVVETVVAHFNEQVSYQTGHTAASLHQILDEALVANAKEQDPLEDDGSFEFPEPTSFTAVAVNQTTGDVMLNLPTVDVMDPDDPRVYAALDEGCNTTCHSSAWGEMATKKLEARGYSFQWKEDADAPTFIGLGSKSTTKGRRSMPFALQAQDGEESIYGHLEPYEASADGTPLLISLYCQVALGMIKDLTRRTVSVMKKGQKVHDSIVQVLTHGPTPFESHTGFG